MRELSRFGQPFFNPVYSFVQVDTWFESEFPSGLGTAIGGVHGRQSHLSPGYDRLMTEQLCFPLSQGSESEAGPDWKRRQVFFSKGGWLETQVFNRKELHAGNRITGPAIIEQCDATTVIPPDWQATVDPFLNLCLRRNSK